MEKLITKIEDISKQRDPIVLEKQPEIIQNVELRDYQLDGLNWMINNYERKINGILGDEMGLGKTLQAISFIGYINSVKHVEGPFLILCPLSIVDNWANEFKNFLPSFNILTYNGTKQEREKMREKVVKEILKQPKKSQKDPKLSFDAILTTYELLVNDIEFLSKFKFRYTIIDEAHRLKNKNSVLYKNFLTNIKCPFRLLLTGTPIQNNLKELHSLLRFIMPKIFSEEEEFLDYFKKVDTQKINTQKNKKKDESDSDSEEDNKNEGKEINVLHKIIRPFLLRRIKEDVVKELPKKKEMTLFTGMSQMQKKYYKIILMKDIARLNSNSKTSLTNIVMQLRKCCNHPYLFDGAEPLFNGEYKIGDHIIENSGKMALLDKLLPKLKKEGHRGNFIIYPHSGILKSLNITETCLKFSELVLLFSQMTRMLDIIQDYLHYRQYSYERLDGSVRGEERYIAIKNFTEDDTFIFLLSTRAGGLGLNLTSADTVIILDSDWNPQADLQAMARAHRLGQKKEVTVIRFCAQNSIEEIILNRALKKLELTYNVIEKGGFDQNDGKDHAPGAHELKEAMKFGLKEICDNEKSSISDEDIDAILNRANQIQEQKQKELDERKNNEVKIDKKSESDDDVEMKDQDKGKQKDKSKSGVFIYDEKAPENYHIFEGEDYTPIEVDDNDKEAFNKLISNAVQNESLDIAVSDDLQSSKKRKIMVDPAELQARKKQKAQENKLKKWQKNGYTSDNIVVEEGDFAIFQPKDQGKSEEVMKTKNKEIDNLIFDENESEDGDIICLTGDATKPQFTLPPDENEIAFILNCLDNSGNWGNGGFFTAISNLSDIPEQKYALAKQMGDIKLGDAHIIQIPSEGVKDIYVINLVVQSRNARTGQVSGIDFNHLREALTKIAIRAKQLNAQIHMPRIGAGTKGFNWYTTERIIRNCLAAKLIPTFVYYFPRRAQNAQQQQFQQVVQNAQNQKQKDVQKKQDAKNVTEGGKPSYTNFVLQNPLADVFSSKVVQFFELEEELEKQLSRYIIAYGGDVVETPEVDEDTNYLISDLSTRNEVLDDIAKELPNMAIVSSKWVLDSVEKGELQAHEEYEIAAMKQL